LNGEGSKIFALSRRSLVKTLYVSNIPFRMEDKDLYPIFQIYGDVLDVRVVVDRVTSRSRGYAFIDMAESKAALEAIDNLNGTNCQGRVIQVAQATPRRSEAGSHMHNRTSRHPHVRCINRTRRVEHYS
jgi:RNA recognition motif-containing protein